MIEKKGPGRPAKKERIPLGGMKLKLAAPQRKGFERRWFNDAGTRIHDALAAGYEFVHDETTQEELDRDKARIKKVVGTQESGQPLYAYLMETKESYYKADQKAKEDSIRETEDAMRAGMTPGQDGQDNRYVPSQGISIRR